MSAELESLLAHSRWIRSLAGHLTRDGQAADDLAQDAWVAALRAAPASAAQDGTAFRRWAAGVLRNLSRQGRRGERRRAQRERDAARDEALPAADELLSRLDEHQALGDLVRELDEPYRTAILLRYFEGLAPEEIARRTGTPLRTVHTRLNRALHQLRAKVAARQGRRAWSILALPWLGAWRAQPPLALWGGLIVKTKIEVALACAALVAVAALGTWWVRRPAGPESLSASAPLATAQLAPPPAPEPLASARDTLADRSVIAPVEPRVPETPAALEEVALGPLSGLVIDTQGLAVPRVQVAFTGFGEEHGQTVETDMKGEFTFEEPPSSGEITIVSEGWCTVLKPTVWSTTPGQRQVLVVAPAITLAGMVSDELGAPLAGAQVELDAPADLRARLGHVLEGSAQERFLATSDELGRFELTSAPRSDGSSLVTSAPGHRADRRAPPSASTYDLAIALERSGGEYLRGRVVDVRGEPLPGALIGLGPSAARSDPQGAFAIRFPEDQHDRLWIVAEGKLPASVERRGPTHAASGAWPDPLLVVLDGEPLSIVGRVLDAAGEPLAGVRVWTDDLTSFGAVEDEDFGPFVTLQANVEPLASGNGYILSSTTNAEGRFHLGGLLERSYQLSAADETMRFALTEPIAAGTRDVVVRMPAGEDVPPVVGRVVGFDGEPIAGITVIPCGALTLADGTEKPVAGSQDVETDAAGRFELHGLGALPTRLELRGEEVMMGTDWEIPAGAQLDQLEVTVPRRCRLQVALDDPAEATRFHVLDEQGERLHLTAVQGTIAWSSDERELLRGRTEVFSVSELARTLVLSGPPGEVRRIELDLVPGEIATVR